MKPFIITLYALFLVAMISGVTIAFRNAESLVEPDYYRKQNDWFQRKGQERRLGLEVRQPASLSTGKNEVTFVLTGHGRPLEKAAVTLFIGSVSSSEHDITCPMRETTPGVYLAEASIPAKGKWLVRMELSSDQIKTSRSWFYDIR